MTKWVAGLGLSATGLILALIVFYLILGMFMDVLSMQVATIPITYPIAMALGRGPDLVRHLHRADVRAGADHAAGGHEPVRGARHPAGQGRASRTRSGARCLMPRIMILFTLLILMVPQIVTWLPAHM